MKAIAVFPAGKEVRLIEKEEPQLVKPAEVKLRILEVGICGTDREIVAFQYGSGPAGSDHLVIGHEALGVVVETGPAVARVKPGDLVVPMVRRPCPHEFCKACRSDRQDFCYSGDFTERGIKARHGFMTECVVEDERYVVPVPGELREVAVLVEPLTIAEKALSQYRVVQQRLPWEIRHSPDDDLRHTAVVLGAGPVGLLGSMALVASGFKTYVYSRGPASDPKASLVESIGATYVATQNASIERLARKVGNIDLVYEAAGASRAAFELMKVLGTNGVFVFTGVPGRKAPVELDTDLIMRHLVLKNQLVFGTVNAGRDSYEAAIRDLGVFMQHWPDAVRSLITGRHPIEAYREPLLGKPRGIKNVIALHGSHG